MMNRRKDGTIYAEHQSITPVKQPGGGEISHFIAIKRDLTEEKQLQAQFLQAQKMEIVGRLAGGIAHDFNNLLTVINGTAEFGVTALKESDPLRGDFLQIQQAGTRAATLTRQLLAFSRRQIMTLDVLNLKTIIDEMQGMLQRLIGEDIDLVVAPGKDVGNVRADAGQIEQVVLNLAVNARDAMPRGGRLTIEMQNVDLDDTYAVLHPGVKPGPHVMLAVSDSGTGMDAATRARIFEPFFTTKGPGKGTGLGLATVYGIVNQSGGSIRVYSEPGCGTTFKIYLPRIDEAAVSTRNTEAKPPAAGTETVLIVEDEEALRNLAVRILRSAGYQVLTARTGSEALQVIGQQNGSVQIVFTDVVMPEMGGRELATHIAESYPDIKVLFSSGYTDDAVLRHGVVDNASRFIGKPYTRAALTHAIRELLDQP
jgi:signal transduction histidine kinase/CheY-like chemotaxis protein